MRQQITFVRGEDDDFEDMIQSMPGFKARLEEEGEGAIVAEKVYKTGQVARIFGVSEQTIRKWARRGVLRGFRMGTGGPSGTGGQQLRFLGSEIKRCLENQMQVETSTNEAMATAYTSETNEAAGYTG